MITLAGAMKTARLPGRSRARRSGAVARADGKVSKPLEIRKILVPIDFSAGSMLGLEYARKLAKKFDASLLILHSLHLQYFVTNDEYARYDLPLLMQQMERSARQQLRNLVQKTDWAGVRVRSSLESGHVGEQICRRAKESGADLIVISTRGTTGLKHLMLGSTAEYVVRHATAPVLVVPNEQRRSPNIPKRR